MFIIHLRLVASELTFKRRHFVAGFEACGLYPVNKKSISTDKLSRSDTDSDTSDDSLVTLGKIRNFHIN